MVVSSKITTKILIHWRSQFWNPVETRSQATYSRFEVIKVKTDYRAGYGLLCLWYQQTWCDVLLWSDENKEPIQYVCLYSSINQFISLLSELTASLNATIVKYIVLLSTYYRSSCILLIWMNLSWLESLFTTGTARHIHISWNCSVVHLLQPVLDTYTTLCQRTALTYRDFNEYYLILLCNDSCVWLLSRKHDSTLTGIFCWTAEGWVC